MPDQLHPLVRLVVGLLALLTTAAAFLLTGVVASFGLAALPALGAAGAMAATVILARVAARGTRLSNTGAAVLVLGLTVAAVGVVVVQSAFLRVYEKAHVATMKANLRNLVEAQDAYFLQHHAYAGTLADLGTQYAPSTGVTISLTASGQDVRATAAHADLPGVTCAIYIGITPIAPALDEREPACNR